MTKQEAVHLLVQRDLQAIPQEWVKIVADSFGECHAYPMWGTMFIMGWPDKEGFIKKHCKLMAKSHFQDEFDEEMQGEMVVVDKDGSPTSIYAYELDDQVLLGVNGAGFDFYDGVWDRLYDILELKWHDEE